MEGCLWSKMHALRCFQIAQATNGTIDARTLRSEGGGVELVAALLHVSGHLFTSTTYMIRIGILMFKWCIAIPHPRINQSSKDIDWPPLRFWVWRQECLVSNVSIHDFHNQLSRVIEESGSCT